MSNELYHHGVPNQEWGVRNGPPYPLQSKYKSPHELSTAMASFKYKEFDKLMSPKQVESTKSGSCHDQTMYEMQELRRMGKDPKGLFIIESDGKNQGGMTHSLAYYEENGETHWFENAWSERAGDVVYDSLEAIKKEIQKAHKSGEYGNSNKYGTLTFAAFDPAQHKVGEDLGTLVNTCLKNETDDRRTK